MARTGGELALGRDRWSGGEGRGTTLRTAAFSLCSVRGFTWREMSKASETASACPRGQQQRQRKFCSELERTTKTEPSPAPGSYFHRQRLKTLCTAYPSFSRSPKWQMIENRAEPQILPSTIPVIHLERSVTTRTALATAVASAPGAHPAQKMPPSPSSRQGSLLLPGPGDACPLEAAAAAGALVSAGPRWSTQGQRG